MGPQRSFTKEFIRSDALNDIVREWRAVATTIAPQSGVHGHGIAQKRPGWVWVISIFYVLAPIWASVSWYMTLSGSVSLTPEAKAYMDSLTAFDYIAAGLQAVISLSAALTLFFLRKAAYHLFCAAFAIASIGMLWQTVSRGWLTAMASIKGGLFGALLGIVLLLAVCFYTKQLSKEGKLR